MKKLLHTIAFTVLLSGMVSSCGYDNPTAPVPAKADFLDVNVTFSHPQVRAREGQTLAGYLYYSDVSGKPVSSLTPDLQTSTELTAVQAAKGLHFTFEGVNRNVRNIYFLLWIDSNESGKLDEGDLAAYYKAASIDKIEAGDAAPLDCLSEYVVTMTIGWVYGEPEFVIPAGKVADYDRNLYTEVVIGPQIWLKENLRATFYNDGTELPATTHMSSLSTPAYANPYVSGEDAETYGYLYNWHVTEAGNPCPEGYHIPTDAEFIRLEKFIAPEATDLGSDVSDAPGTNTWRGGAQELGFKMKSAEAFDGSDVYGLSLVPGGIYTDVFSQGAAADTKSAAIWTADTYPGNKAKAVRRLFRNKQAGSGRGADNKTKGHSLRCVRTNPDYEEVTRKPLAKPELTVQDATVSWPSMADAAGYEVKINGTKFAGPDITVANGRCLFDVAAVCPAQVEDKRYTVEIVALGDNIAWLDSGPASVEVTIAGTGGIVEKEYVFDYDGNKYEVVVIGLQTWMREHLRTTCFNDGTPIPGSSGATFAAQKSAAYVDPYGNAEQVERFGLLYNWYAVATEGKNPCPAGYHIPSDAEFIQLERSLAPEADDLDGPVPANNTLRGVAQGLGTRMKSDMYGFGGRADSEFAAVPGGTYAKALSKDASSDAPICVLWTTDSYNDAKAARRMLQHTQAGSGRGLATKVSGHSLRCLKDQPNAEK